MDATQSGHSGSFDSRSFLGVSEIGIATDDVPAYVAHLEQDLGILPFGAVDDQFTAVGQDNYGRLIVVKTGRKWYPESVTPALPLPTRIKIVGHPEITL